MKQPALGVVASVLVMAISLGFISLFTFPTFASWVSFLTICFIPMQIVIAVTWGAQQPGFAAARPQPVKGLLLMLLALFSLRTTQAASYPWLWTLPFLFTFVGGVFADALETRQRKLFLGLTGSILVTQALLCLAVLPELAR